MCNLSLASNFELLLVKEKRLSNYHEHTLLKTEIV
jgi:hypothetical protein